MCVPKVKAPAPVKETSAPAYVHNPYLDSLLVGGRDGATGSADRASLVVPLGSFAGRGGTTSPSAAGTPGRKTALSSGRPGESLAIRPQPAQQNGDYTGPTDSAGNPIIPPTPVGPPDPGAPRGGSTGSSPGTFPTPDPGYFVDPNDPFGVPFRIGG